jgi:hypothetical protein
MGIGFRGGDLGTIGTLLPGTRTTPTRTFVVALASPAVSAVSHGRNVWANSSRAGGMRKRHAALGGGTPRKAVSRSPDHRSPYRTRHGGQSLGGPEPPQGVERPEAVNADPEPVEGRKIEAFTPKLNHRISQRQLEKCFTFIFSAFFVKRLPERQGHRS